MQVDRRASQALLVVAGFVSLLVCLGVFLWIQDGQQIVQARSSRPAESYPLNFLVIGDWGRNGEHNQTYVAKEVSTWHSLPAHDLQVDPLSDATH